MQEVNKLKVLSIIKIYVPTGSHNDDERSVESEPC